MWASAELAALEDLGPEQAAVELAHDDDPVDDLAFAVEDRPIAVKGDGNCVEIDRRRQPPVEFDLGAAVLFAQLDGGKIEKTEVDRLLELVDDLSGQKDRRDVGLEEPNLIDRMVIERRLGKGVHECGVIQGGLLGGKIGHDIERCHIAGIRSTRG